MRRSRLFLLILPIPDLIEEFLTAEIMSCLARTLVQTFFDDGLGGDTGVVEARDEQHGLSQHAIPTTQTEQLEGFKR